jgi:hypothetical protein
LCRRAGPAEGPAELDRLASKRGVDEHGPRAGARGSSRSELLRLGADVEIIEPAELRARMSVVARSMTAIYQAD